MQLDPKQLKALAQMDDKRFSAMLYTAAMAVGLSAEQAKAAAANAPSFKKILQNASKDDLAKLQTKLQGSPAELIKELGGEKNE